MAADLIFPLDYGSSSDVPMIGFGAAEISAGRGIANLDIDPIEQWAFLPIPIEGVTTGYQNAWEESGVNMMAAATQKGVGLITKMLGSIAAGPQAPAPVDPRPGHGGGGQSTNANVAKVDSVGGAIEEMVRGKVGLATGLNKRALEQTYVSYSGPGYRSHSFSFSLKPKSSAESDAIDNIITFFKKFSSPVQENLGEVGDIIRLYKNPHLFAIKFVPSKGLPLIAASACTNVGVKYGGEKYNIFNDSEKPIQIDLSLEFKEMIILDRKKITDGY